MRILIINYEFPPIGAGGGKASFEIAKSLVERGHAVKVITARPSTYYGLAAKLSLILGCLFWIYLAYAKISWGEDISNHGFTILGTLLLLTGFIMNTMSLVWELINPIRGLKANEFIEGVEISRVPVFRQRQDYCSTFEMGTFVASGAWASLMQAPKFNPDIVHVFFGIPDGPIGWLLKRAYHLPYIISLRGADVPSSEVKRFAKHYRYLRPFIRYLWRDADALAAVSNGLRSHALETDPDTPMDIIPNAIDLSLFTPPITRGEKDDASVSLLFVGRLTAFKNVETLLEAVSILRNLNPGDFRLEIIGEGERRANLERKISELEIGKLVRMSGWVGHPEIIDRYRQADIFVTATIWEGMPNTVLEAMACGLPIIGTRASGMGELVRDGVNGYLVPTNDAAAMADRIARLVNNGFERRRMGKESRKIAEREFAWDYIAQKYEEVYQRVLVAKKEAQ
jgi:glycosyltransferase involved in cell wall biosynthesis